MELGRRRVVLGALLLTGLNWRLVMSTKADVQAWYGQGASIIDGLPDGPTPPPSAGLWTQYDSAFLGTRTYNIVGVDANGNPGVPPVKGLPYTSIAGDATHGQVVWGTTYEHHAILTDARGGGDATQWGALEYYSAAPGTVPWTPNPEEVTQCDWINLDNNTSVDMTGFTVGPTGGIMCPQIIPASGNYRLRQWGWIWSNLKENGGVRSDQFYWQADYTFGTVVANPAWTGAGPQSRLGIIVMQAWYRALTGGWDPTLGTAPTAPFDAQGNPVVVDVTYPGWDALGQNAGVLWRHNYPTYKVSLSSVV